MHVPTFQDVTRQRRADHAAVPAPLPHKTIQGDPGTQLQGYLSETVTVPPETIESSSPVRLGCLRCRPATKPPSSVPAAPAQPPVEGTVTTKAPGVGQRVAGVTSEYFEFDVDAVHDNAKMRGSVTPTLPADLDLYLQRRGADGTWSEAGSGSQRRCPRR